MYKLQGLILSMAKRGENKGLKNNEERDKGEGRRRDEGEGEKRRCSSFILSGAKGISKLTEDGSRFFLSFLMRFFGGIVCGE